VAVPFLLTQPGGSRVLGYTRSSSIIPAPELPSNLMKQLPRDGLLPITLLAMA